MNQAILIDMGDTIIHNYDVDYSRALSLVYEKSNNKNVSKEQYINYSLKILENIFSSREYIEFKMIDYLKQIIDYFNMTFDISYSELELFFALNSCKIKYVNNIELFLKHIKNKGYKIMILSNTSFSKSVIVAMLGELVQYFDDIIVSSDYVFRKPHFSFFDIGISRIQFPKDKIYYIGNSYYFDVYGAYQAGIKCIWFNEDKESKDEVLEAIYQEINSYLELIEKDF